MNTQRKRSLPMIILSILLSFAMVLSLTIGQVEAAKKVKMPTKMTEYEMNDEGKWIKRRYTTYTYNKKGDCTKTKRTFYDEDGTKDYAATITLKYTYKKGKKTKVAVKNTTYYKVNNEKYTFTYDKKQRISKIQSFDEDSKSKGDIDVFTYDSQGYVKTIKKTTDNDEFTDREQIWTYDTVINGSTVTITFNGRDFYGDPRGPEITTLKSNLVEKVQNDYYDYIEEYSYTIATKGTAKGLVTTKYCKKTGDDGTVDNYKTTYSYGKKKSTKTKYYKVINNDIRVVVSHLGYRD